MKQTPTASHLAPRPTAADIIEIRRNRPMVSSVRIAELFERPHKSVLRVLRELSGQEAGENLAAQKGQLPKRGKGVKAKDSAAVLSGHITWDQYQDVRNKTQPIAWLDEEAALIAMPFIGGRHAHIGQRKLVRAYLAYRDAFQNPQRPDLIRTKRDASRVLTDAIVDMRAEQGKDTSSVHYMSEQKLCNWIVTGKFQAIDESSLDNDGLELLRLVRERNAALLLAGIDYPGRKKRLLDYAMRQRTRIMVAEVPR
jgi:hypothetical protein